MKTGKRISVKVHGFQEAKRRIYELIKAGVVKCHGGNCDQEATHVFWQDRAEWYPLCEEHREYGQMWTGHTDWNPRSFSVNALPAKVDAWYSVLSPDEKKIISVNEYDATDYYSMLVNPMWKPVDTIYISGDDNSPNRIYVDLHELNNGKIAYKLNRVFGNHSYIGSFVGMFDDTEDAFRAAKHEWES